MENALNDRRLLLVSSSSWKDVFLQDLNTLPAMEGEECGDVGEECMACNRTNHPATFKVVMKGRPYPSGDLWLYDMGTAKASPAKTPEKGKASKARKGELRPGPKGKHASKAAIPRSKDFVRRTYYLGRFCRARTHLYHALLHYKLRLLGTLRKKLKRKVGTHHYSAILSSSMIVFQYLQGLVKIIAI